MSGWILASGGNEFNDEYRQADQAALDKRVDKSQPLLIVVTAGLIALGGGEFTVVVDSDLVYEVELLVESVTMG